MIVEITFLKTICQLFSLSDVKSCTKKNPFISNQMFYLQSYLIFTMEMSVLVTQCVKNSAY